VFPLLFKILSLFTNSLVIMSSPLNLTPLFFLLRTSRPDERSFTVIARATSTPSHQPQSPHPTKPSSPVQLLRLFDIVASVIPVSLFSTNSKAPALQCVIIRVLIAYVMPVSLANMCDCHSVLRSHPLGVLLNSFIVMFGLRPLLALPG
jgi:hypothetical protein